MRKLALCILVLFAFYIVAVYGFTDVYNVNKESGQTVLNISFGSINGNNVNFRVAPNKNSQVISKFQYGDTVKVVGKCNDFYLIQTNDDKFGVVSSEFITLKANKNDKTEPEKLLDLINVEREKNGILKLSFDATLMDITSKKVNDMVANNYFNSQSPTLGSPFDMMKAGNIEYRTAAESICGNTDITKAFNTLLSDESNKNNLLNRAFNYVGIGIKESSKYGNIYSLMFIGK